MNEAQKECVACAELIKQNAKLCRFCNTIQTDTRYFQVVPVPTEDDHVEAYARLQKQIDDETTCVSCGRLNSRQRKRCVSCDAWLSHSPATEGSPKIQANSTPTPAKNLGPTPPIAIAAAIVSFFVPVLGLVLGYVARDKVRDPKEPREGDGLATLAIVIGWIFSIAGSIWLATVVTLAANTQR